MTSPSQAPANTDAVVSKDNSYVLGYHGFVYTTARSVSGQTIRQPAVLLITADLTPFEIGLRGGETLTGNAFAVAPQVARSLQAENCKLLSFNVLPSHPSFHAFRAIPRPGLMALARHLYSHLDDALLRLFEARSGIDEAESVFAQMIDTTREQLPPSSPPDVRALEMIRMLDENPHLSVDDLAVELGRSVGWMSRMFSAAVGMSLRDYQAWLKQRRVYDLLYTQRSLTHVALASGFGDSPQFSRTFQRWYGQTPSFSRNPKHVQVFVHGGSNKAPGADESGALSPPAAPKRHNTKRG